MENKPKKLYKKWWFWVIVLIILGGIGSSMGDKDKKAEDKSTSTTSQVKKEEPKKEEPKKEQFDFTNAELNQDNITKAIVDTLGKDKLVKVELENSNGKNIVNITYDPGEVWDEKALVKTTAVEATKTMEILFKNPNVDKIWFWTQTNMTDAKGNSSKENVVNVALTKENAKDINWSKFKEMVQVDYKNLFNIADGKFIHPGIAKKLN